MIIQSGKVPKSHPKSKIDFGSLEKMLNGK